MSDGKIYNLGDDYVISLKVLAEMMITMVNQGTFELLPFPPERKSIDIGDYYSDFSLITNELGWKPKVRLKDGLLKTIDFYNNFHHKYIY